MDKKSNLPEDKFWCINPLDFRYYGNDEEFFSQIYPYASEEAYVKFQLMVEAALATELAARKICSSDQAVEIINACNQVTAKEVYEEEKKSEHNIRALVSAIQNKINNKSTRSFVHLFATSNDITDTANALRLKKLTTNVIIPDLIRLQLLLTEIAREYANVPQIGRTHGRHAEPITFGFALANYVDRFSIRTRKIIDSANEMRGMLSGAVGAYNALSLVDSDPALFELDVLRRLELRPSESSISSQIVQPEYVTDLVYSIISCFSVLANLADDIRHLRRSEINEIHEGYQVGKIGSSTMPHKVNPKNFEHVKSQWKAQMPRMITVFMDQISEHQRDLTNSASSRETMGILVTFDYCVTRMIDALKEVTPDKEKMKENLDSAKGSFVAEPLYVLLTIHGFADAYNYVRTLVAKSHDSKIPLSELIWKDESIKPILKKLKPDQAEILRDPSKYIGDSERRTHIACDNAINSIKFSYLKDLPEEVSTKLRKEFTMLHPANKVEDIQE